MRDFRELKVWEKSHKLTRDVYEATARFPKEELYGLTSQIRRSCSSIPANIAEGCGRDGVSELARFSRIAAGSASELEYHLLLANELNFLNTPDHGKLTTEVTEIKRMLTSFIQKLRADS
ncbi:four helix bundle protein [soil metagenome]